MTFPIVATILDAFTRADATTAGAGWTQMMETGVKDFGISSNLLYNPDNAYQAMTWNAATYGPDCEGYITITTLMPLAHTVVVYARIKDAVADAWTFDGYAVRANRWDDGGTDTLTLSIARYDNAVATQLGATVNITDHANGDQLGGRFQRSELKLFYNGTERMVRVDATYALAGYLAIYTDDSTVRLNDFGGGTLVTNMPKGMMHYKRQRQ